MSADQEMRALEREATPGPWPCATRRIIDGEVEQ